MGQMVKPGELRVEAWLERVASLMVASDKRASLAAWQRIYA